MKGMVSDFMYKCIYPFIYANFSLKDLAIQTALTGFSKHVCQGLHSTIYSCRMFIEHYSVLLKPVNGMKISFSFSNLSFSAFQNFTLYFFI